MLILVILLGGCAKRSNTPVACGFSLIESLEEMIASEEYIAIYGNVVDEYIADVRELRRVDLSEPEYICKITFDSEKIIEKMSDSEISSSVLELYQDKIAPSFVSQINVRDGMKSVVLSSCFSIGESFECKEVKENTVYFYVYEDIVVAVSFADGEGDACYANASLIIADSLDTESEDAIEDSLNDLFPGCNIKVEKVK